MEAADFSRNCLDTWGSDSPYLETYTASLPGQVTGLNAGEAQMGNAMEKPWKIHEMVDIPCWMDVGVV